MEHMGNIKHPLNETTFFFSGISMNGRCEKKIGGWDQLNHPAGGSPMKPVVEAAFATLLRCKKNPGGWLVAVTFHLNMWKINTTMWPPPSDVRWFINPMNYSYRYHKPVRDIGVINAPTERKFVNGGSFHSLNASWDRSSGHREKRSGIHQRKSWVTVWKSCVSLIPGRVIIIL